MQKILVVGGAGFLGSHLCEELLKKNCSVECWDDLSTGSVRNIENLRKIKNFKFLQRDILDPHLPTSNLPGFDRIFNLASPASPEIYQKNPIRTFKVNVLGTLNALELARKNSSKFLQASTSEIYGDPLRSPQDEGYWGNVNPIGYRSCYDEGKRAAETLTTDFNRTYSVPTKIVRIFNTYGPRMDQNDGRVVSNFICQALQGQNLTVYGDGAQTRSFCFVDDLIAGIVKMSESDDEVTGPVNLGNPAEFSILELAEKVISVTKSKSSIIFKPLPSDDPRQRKPDISLASRLLAWAPKIDLDDGLSITAAYFKSLLKT